MDWCILRPKTNIHILGRSIDNDQDAVFICHADIPETEIAMPRWKFASNKEIGTQVIRSIHCKVANKDGTNNGFERNIDCTPFNPVFEMFTNYNKKKTYQTIKNENFVENCKTSK